MSLVAKGERICFGAVAPPLSLAWRLERHAPILQMVFEGPNSTEQAVGGVARLGASDLPSMVDLTELVYPDYFRPTTAENGVFYGVFDDGCLVAMAGTRFTTDGFTEVTAVCTHPDHQGRGHARRLVDRLVAHIISDGDQPFLHVDEDNERAIGVYERAGFIKRRIVPLWVVTRV